MPRNPADGRGHRQTVSRNINGLSVRTKVWLERDGRFVIGEGSLDLLEAIDASGSLRAAARRVGWSYRHAWGYLRNAERLIGLRLTQPVPGKGRARGTALTASGQAPPPAGHAGTPGGARVRRRAPWGKQGLPGVRATAGSSLT